MDINLDFKKLCNISFATLNGGDCFYYAKNNSSDFNANVYMKVNSITPTNQAMNLSNGELVFVEPTSLVLKLEGKLDILKMGSLHSLISSTTLPTTTLSPGIALLHYT